MPRVGRRRTKDLELLPGLRPVGDRLYWQPPTARERAERLALNLNASVPFGKILRVRGRIALTQQQRLLYAEVSGLREAVTEGTVGELLDLWKSGPIKTKPNGKPRADSTIQQYRYRMPAIYERFGRSRYGKTEADVAAGKGLHAGQIQDFVSAAGSLGRPYLAILSAAFNVAILANRCTYNPCDKVTAPANNARTREPLDWELEVLGTLASPVIALILETKGITGYRISEIISRHRRDMTPVGIRFRTKGAKWEMCEWSPGLRAIVAAAEQLLSVTKFPASPLFPSARGTPYTYKGWYSAWRELVAKANRQLDVDGVIDPDTLVLHAALSIEDLNVHDVRSKVHDDAEAMGREGHEQLGNTEAVADKHYARREKHRRPLR